MMTVPACPLLVPSLLARMGADRTARLEVLAGPEGALAAIRANIRRSVLTWCGVDAGGVVNMGGVLPGGEGWGYVWQFITDAVREHKRAYLTQAKDMMRRAKAILPALRTVIEADNQAALRHARRNGLRPGAPETISGVMACRCEAA